VDGNQNNPSGKLQKTSLGKRGMRNGWGGNSHPKRKGGVGEKHGKSQTRTNQLNVGTAKKKVRQRGRDLWSIKQKTEQKKKGLERKKSMV